jgi:hypothetical protein
MASTYSTNLKIELIGTAEQAGIWGVTTNTNLGTALEQAIVGKADVTMSSTTVTLTLTNANTAQDARAIYLNLTGSPGGAAVLEVPAIEKPYIVKNGSDQQVTIKVSGQTGVAVPVGKTMWLYNNGTDVTNALDNLPSGATVGGTAISTTTGTVTSVATGTGLTGGPITSSGTVSVATNGITNTLLRDSVALSIIGRSANSTGDPADIAAGTDHQVLRRSGTTLEFGAIALNQSAAVTGTLPVASGGTGATSLTTNNVLIGNGTSAVQFVAPGDSGNILTSDGTTWTSTAPSGGGSAVGSTLYLNNVYGGF